ncbi:MAG: hypothetical protein AB8G77_16600 [Rhodothermales bacterium]
MSRKKFRFTLASILNLRKHETEKKKQDLAKKLKDRKSQEKEVSEARKHLADISNKVEKKQALTVKFLKRQEAFHFEARNALLKANERLDDLIIEEQQTRADLIQKKSAEEALQSLHDQEKANHIRGIESAEDKQIEEQALENYRRKQLAHKK